MFEDKTIAIVGCGGLGGFVIEEVARLNPKKLILFDGDKYNPSNLNRQLFSTLASMGAYKAEQAAHRVEMISNSNVCYHNEFISDSNINLLNECDLVFDCVDNIDTRLLISSFCFNNNIPLVHGAITYMYGEVCLCLPDRDLLRALYHEKEEEKRSTNSFSVAAVASMQVAVANKYFTNDYSDIVDKIIVIDLQELSITKLKI